MSEAKNRADNSSALTDKHFGARLKTAFKNASQAEIARQLEITEAGVSKYLKGSVPPPKMLLRISVLTNCSVDWLLTGNNPPDLSLESLIERKIREIVLQEIETGEAFSRRTQRILRSHMPNIPESEAQKFLETTENEARKNA